MVLISVYIHLLFSKLFLKVCNSLPPIPFWMVIQDLNPSVSKTHLFYSPQLVLDFLLFANFCHPASTSGWLGQVPPGDKANERGGPGADARLDTVRLVSCGRLTMATAQPGFALL